MSRRRIFADRGLVTQFAWVGLGVAVGAGGLASVFDPGSQALALGAAGGGALVALACALLARRTALALHEIDVVARLLRREDAADDANIAVLESCADLRDLTTSLRRLVDAHRERQRALLARNVALGQSLQLRTHELSTLEDLSTGLATKSELGELIDEALRALEQTIEYSSASVWARAVRGLGGQVALLGYRAADQAEHGAVDLRGMRLSRPNLQRYEQIEREGAPIIENKVRQSLLSWLWSKVTDDSRSSALYRATRSWMGVPLKFRDEVLGVLRVDHHEQDYFDAERSRLLNAIGSQTALAMRHAQLMAQERDVAVIAERNRIARDLHDAVSQTLFAANVVAETLGRTIGQGVAPDARVLRDQAGALEKLNRGALAEMRLLMFELRPDALEHARFADLLKHAIEALACRGDFAIERIIDGDEALPSTTKIQLYRIAQEALSNIARHSEARHVVVAWRTQGAGHSVLRLADDGKGFDPREPRPGHFGLGNMAARAAEIGAVLTVTSAPGEGAEVRVELGRPEVAQP